MEKEKLEALLILSDTTLKQALKKLTETGEKILFVTDKRNRLLGTLTDGDIRREIINGFEFNDGIENIMSRDFVAVKCDTPSVEKYAKELMIKHKIEQVPMLDKRGVIVDAIVWTDVLEDKKRATPRQTHPNQVVIMAGGKGTRLDPFTRILPKPLIPISNKPVIEIIMERFYQSGFSKFIYTLNYKKEYLKLFLQENKFPYTIDWVEEEDFMGTAGGLSLVNDKVTDTFFVVNCDSLLDIDFEPVIEWHKQHKAAMTIIGCHNEVKIPFGVLELSDGRLKTILEKPTKDVIINTGVYVLEPYLLSYIPKGQPMDMNQLIEATLKREKVSVYPILSGWFDFGQWKEYAANIEKIEGKKR